MRLASVLIAVAPLALLSSQTFASGPQAPESAPAVSVERVRLDVVVLDRDGRTVGGLVRDDFEVLEDSKRQTISNFSGPAAETTPGAATAPADAGTDARAARSGAAAPTPAARRVLIVVDDLHVASGSVETVRRTLRRFVDETVVPDDEVALVMTGSHIGDVARTRDRALLRQAIDRIVARADVVQTGQGSQLTAEQAELILRGDPQALRLAARLATDEPGHGATYESGDPRVRGNNVTPRDFVPTGGETPAAVEPEVRGAALQAKEQARALLEDALSRTDRTLGELEVAMRGMAELTGRKICLLVSDGFLAGRGTGVERTQALQQVVDAATRSGMAVYALLPAGIASVTADATVGSGGAAAPDGLREKVMRASELVRQEALRGLTADTGGFVLRGADALDAGLRRMLAENDQSYLIAYESKDRKRDGRFRRISVRLPRRSGLVARTRSGYFAPKDVARAAPSRAAASPAAAHGAARPLTMMQAEIALGGALPEKGLPVALAAEFVKAADGPQATVRGQVALDGVRLQSAAEGRQRAQLDVVGGVYDERGSLVGRPFGRKLDVDCAPEECARLQRAGLPFDQTLSLPPGRYQVRVLVLDAAHRPLGGSSRGLEVPDLRVSALALSTLFLSTASGASSAAVPGVGESEQLLRRFRRSDSLRFQLFVYNAKTDASGASDVVLQAQIQAGGKLLFASKPQQALLLLNEDGTPMAETNSLPLSALEPGAYELRVAVVDRKANVTAARSVDFSVE